MVIKEIEIIDFWGHYNIRWSLNDSVNILTGINGAGKSTLFDLIASSVTGIKMSNDLINKATLIKIKFKEDNEEAIITTVNFNDSFLSLTKKAQENEIFKELQEDVEADFHGARKSKLNSLKLSASISSVSNGKGERIPAKQFFPYLHVDIISTFDIPLSIYIDDHSKWDSLVKEGVRSSLDKELNELQERYSYYIGNLANKIEKSISKGQQPTLEFLQNLYTPKNNFINIINDLFSQTGKHIDENSSKLQFILNDGERRLSIYQLSSGEKQMLYILWTVLLQDQRPYILFMDEPEISLHIDWQELLIEKIRSINPNCQILLATHAPSVILDGWQTFVTNIDDIKIRR